MPAKSTVLRVNKKSSTYSAFYQVESESRPGSFYVVARRISPDRWECGCPAWTRHSPRVDCTHIDRVRRELNFRSVAAVEETQAAPQVRERLGRFAALDVGV